MKSISSVVIASLFLALSSLPAHSDSSCAKDMFFDQLDSPNEKLNTGLKYWIQLRRNGTMKIVDNQTKFSAGDEIRFVVVPNISGYAYVVLEKGTTGKRKVLFPNSYEPGGKVTAGRQFMLPARGYLRFDNNPGTEIVRIVTSRKVVTEKSLLEENASNKIVIASSTAANMPVRNQNCMVAFAPAEKKSVDFESADESKSLPEFSKDLTYVPSTTAARPRLHVSSKRKSMHAVSRKKPGVTIDPANRPGSVTVINIEPDQSLVAEIELKHI